MSGRGTPWNGDPVRADPRYAALRHEATSAMLARNDAAAERAAHALVRANPREHAAWNVLAVVALRRGNGAAAAEAAGRAHELDRKNPDYLNTLGAVYADLGRYDDALAALRRALRLRPAFADAHYNVGKVQDWRERLPEAQEAYRRALAIEPTHADAKHNLARVLMRMGHLEPALALAREAHADLPDDAERIVNLARALADSNGLRAGAEFIERCLERQPANARLHSLLAILLLSLGEWRAGWREYAWRTQADRSSDPTLRPLADDLRGRAVCLLADQGLGDMLFFLRFVAGIRARSGTVVFQAPSALAPLLAEHPDLDRVVPVGSPLPDDLKPAATFPLGDLPYVLETTDVPPPFPLKPRADLVREWRAALARAGPAPYVGLTWRAGTDPRATSEFVARREMLFKEISLPHLAGATRGVRGTLVSVQRLPAAGETAELARLAGRPVHDLSAINSELEQVTALLATLDEYVGVSNTNMHLRAGLGLTARVLVPYPPEFRWMADGECSPWFPGFRVYRQRIDRRWDDALAHLDADLRAI
jgi:tetratricopeptide (TPR) repeat protein